MGRSKASELGAIFSAVPKAHVHSLQESQLITSPSYSMKATKHMNVVINILCRLLFISNTSQRPLLVISIPASHRLNFGWH